MNAKNLIKLDELETANGESGHRKRNLERENTEKRSPLNLKLFLLNGNKFCEGEKRRRNGKRLNKLFYGWQFVITVFSKNFLIKI